MRPPQQIWDVCVLVFCTQEVQVCYKFAVRWLTNTSMCNSFLVTITTAKQSSLWNLSPLHPKFLS